MGPCLHPQELQLTGTFRVYPVTRKIRGVQKDRYALAVVFTGTDFPDALLRNTQTGRVNVYNTYEGAERRLRSLPSTITFCSGCALVPLRHILTELGWFHIDVGLPWNQIHP